MCHWRTQKSSKFMHFVHIFSIPVNFLPFTLVDPGPADSSAAFGAGAGANAQPGNNGTAGEPADLVTFPEVGDFDVRYVHGYGKVVTLFCPFWVKHKRGQEEKVFLVPFLYMRPPNSHTWAVVCTPDELGQLQKVHGVPLNEIGGVLPGTREVGSVAPTAALAARVEGKEACSDKSRKVEAEARKLAQGKDVALESSAGKKSSMVPGKRSRGRPPQGARKGAGSHSGRATLRAATAAVGE